MTPDALRASAWNGLWKQNPGLVQLLGLCPILAVSTTLVNGVSLGLATVLVMAVVNFSVACLRQYIPYSIRIPVFVLIIAAVVAVVDMLLNAYLHPLYLVLGIFIPLIATNCIVLARVEAFASRQAPLDSTLDGVLMGLGLVWVLALLGAVRELFGNGTLFDGIDMVFPSLAPLQPFGDDYPGFILAMLPPGAFFTLGLLIALFNRLNARAAAQAVPSAPAGPLAAAPVTTASLPIEATEAVEIASRAPSAALPAAPSPR